MGRAVRAILAGVALGVVAVASACSLTTSLDGFSGADGAPGVDGSVGSSSGDASDARSQGGDGGTSFCATQPSTLFLCDDFDDGKFPLPFEVALKSTGTATLNDDNVRSAPHALLLTLPASSTDVGASLVHTLPAATQDVVVDFDVRIDERGGNDYDAIKISGGGADVGFQFNSDGSLSWDEDYADSTPGVEVNLGKSMPADWAHLRLTVHIAGTNAVTELFVDGVTAGTRNFRVDALTASKTTISLGDGHVTSPSPGWKVRVDNLTVDRK